MFQWKECPQSYQTSNLVYILILCFKQLSGKLNSGNEVIISKCCQILCFEIELGGPVHFFCSLWKNLHSNHADD